MIRPSLFFIFVLVTAAGADNKNPVAQELAEFAKASAKSLKEILSDEYWMVTVSVATIKIESKFEVFPIQLISPAFSPLPIDPSEDELRKSAKGQKYVIRLKFAEQIDCAKFSNLRAQRQLHADVLNFGATSKDHYAKAETAYLGINVPRYRLDLPKIDIYRQLPERPSVSLSPLSAIAKIGAAKALIDLKFGRLFTGND